MASKNIKAGMNGAGRRQCDSWIERFIAYTDNLESAEIFRRWTAISVIASVLQQKVWINTGGELYPNVYVWLIGKAGIGKTRAIGGGRGRQGSSGVGTLGSLRSQS